MSVILLVADSGLGKTTACRRVVDLARANGLRAAGLLSLPVYEGQARIAISLHDVATGQERILARANGSGDGSRVGIWMFEPDVLGWGRNILASLPDCDLIIIDEIGPLEIEMRQGLTNALDVLNKVGYGVAVVTLRPSLVQALMTSLGSREISTVFLTGENRDGIPATILRRLGEKATTKVLLDDIVTR